MFFEIKPIKDIGKHSFYLDSHYLGKDKLRNTFICSADTLYECEVIFNGKIFVGSWQKKVQLIKRKKAYMVYRLTEKGETLLKTIFGTLGSLDFSFLEEIEENCKLTSSVAICDINKGMLLSLNTTTPIVLKKQA